MLWGWSYGQRDPAAPPGWSGCRCGSASRIATDPSAWTPRADENAGRLTLLRRSQQRCCAQRFRWVECSGMATARDPRRSATRSVAVPKAAGGELKIVRGGLKTGKTVPAWRPVERTQFLIDTVGGVTNLARTLGVSPSQPSRWRSGEEVPSPQIAARLLDLDHVVALAMQAWDPKVVMDWMTTSNGFLDGAEPIEVLRQRGSSEVIEALKATISGAYA